MVRWVNDRHCTIDIDGRESTHNVNRLIKHYIWDGAHICTDDKTQKPIQITPTPPKPPLKTGDIIIFPTTYNSEHKCHFGVGKVLDATKQNNLIFQWYGNLPLAEARKPFYPGWVDPKDNKGYYTYRKTPTHPPWTNLDTSTQLGAESVILAEPDILNSSHRISAKYKNIIEKSVGAGIEWE